MRREGVGDRPHDAGSRPSETLGTASSTIRTLRSRACGRPPKRPAEQLAHVRPAARIPAPVPGFARRLVAPRDRVPGGRHLRSGSDGRRDQRDRREPGHAGAHARDRRDRRSRAPSRRAHVRATRDLRTAGARRGVRHARRALLALPPAVVRLLRPQPDGAADVTRDDRPPVGALLPRLRAHLLRAARRHHRRRHARAVRLQLGAGARRARDHAGDRPGGVPLQPCVAARAPRRPADAR